jgi:hypothetical protein
MITTKNIGYKNNPKVSLNKKGINIPTYKINTCFFSSKVEPIITYNDTLLNKFNALDDNKGKSGIYR